MDLPLSQAIALEFRRAWRDSNPDDPADRHEEGGFIVLAPDGVPSVERWPRGERSRITPPALSPDNRYNNKVVIAAFHTHPSPPVDEAGREWEQGPSESDRRWHMRRRLEGLVVSRLLIYGIDTTGIISVVGKHDEVLSA